MAIQYASAVSANANSITIPTHQLGDVIVLIAYGDTAAITVPSGWFTRHTSNIPARGFIAVCWKNANSSSETSGTFTNANQVACAVYRSDANVAMAVGGSSNASAANAATIGYPSLSQTNVVRSDSSSWILGLVGTRTDDIAQTPPTGMVNRASAVSGTEIAIHDSNGGLASWTSTAVSTTSVSYQSCMVEVFETGQEIGAGGGGGGSFYLPRGMRGGFE